VEEFAVFLEIIYVGLGGLLGAVSRFCFYEIFNKFIPSFPLSTLLVNVVGSALLGFILYSFAPGKILPIEYRHFLNIGFIGAFTTMSTFAFETIALAESGSYFIAIANIVLNVSLSLSAILGGKWLALLLFK
jgi:CrcB protein